MLPLISSATCPRHYQFGDYRALMLTGITASGVMQYHHALLVYRRGRPRPCLAVSCEYLYEEDADCPVLGLFAGNAHSNYGEAPELTDPEAFANRALALAMEQLQLPAETPVETTPLEPPHQFE